MNRQLPLRKIAALGASTALLGTGLAAVAVAPATADATGFAKVSAPDSVQAGQRFTLKCKIAKSSGWKGWRGSTVKVREKGASVRASRTIGARGDCTMHLVLNAKGARQIRVVAIGGNNVLQSKWIDITVN